MQFSFRKVQTVLLCAGLFLSSFAVNAAVDPAKASKKKFREIDKIVAGFEVSGKRFYDPLVQEEIKDAVDQKIPLTPVQKVQQDSWTERNEKARRNVEKANKFDEGALRKEAEAEAAAKYPMAALKSEVTVDYIRGKQGFQAKGKLYQIDLNEGTVKVGNSRVYFADMSKETRSRFDKSANEQIRRDYVALKLSEKRQEIIQLQKKECEKIEHAQIQQNLKNGYLYQNGKWTTAEKYVNKKLAAIAKRHKKEDDEKAKLKAEEEKKVREAEAAKLAEMQKKAEKEAAAKNAQNDKQSGTDIDAATAEAARAKLLKDLADKQKDIQSSFSGIDAFQGYEGAGVWGMQTSEVRQALNINSENAGVDEDVILNFPEDSIVSKVILHYFDATFRMVETVYKDMDDVQFAEFHGKLREQFGLSKTEEASKDELFKLIQENKLTPDKVPMILDPSKDESGAGFAVPKMIDQKAYVFVWDGLMSRGILTFTRNAEKKMYENIKIYRVSLPLRWQEKEREKREAEANKITSPEADKK